MPERQPPAYHRPAPSAAGASRGGSPLASRRRLAAASPLVSSVAARGPIHLAAWGLLVVVACLLLTRGAVPGSAPPVAAQPIPASPTPLGPETGGSPFIGDGEPPESVRALLPWSGGGAGIVTGTTCWFAPDGRLLMGSGAIESPNPVPCEVPVNDHVWFEVGDPSRGVGDRVEQASVRITRPDGSALEQVPGDIGEPIWWIPLGASLGRYTVTARHGDRDLRGEFTISRRRVSQDDPRPLMRVWPRFGPPGTQFRVTMAGFEPRRDIPLRLYLGRQGGNPTYLASLATVRADDRGEASYTIPTRTTDPEGVYLIVSDPESKSADIHGPMLAIATNATWDDILWGRRDIWAEDRVALERLARSVVLEANRTWAAVVAKDGRPLDSLLCVYDGEVLAEALANEKGRRTRGEYRVARMTRPLELVDVRLLPAGMIDGHQVSDQGGIEVTVVETWDDRTYDLNGRPIRDRSGRTAFRYVMRNESPQPWTEASVATGCHYSSWWIFKAESLGPR